MADAEPTSVRFAAYTQPISHRADDQRLVSSCEERLVNEIYPEIAENIRGSEDG